VIPKTETANRIRENFDVFGWELTKEDLDKIRKLNSGKRAIDVTYAYI